MSLLWSMLLLLAPLAFAVTVTVAPRADSWLGWYFTNFSYYIILAMAAGWCVALARVLPWNRQPVRDWCRRHGAALAVCLLLTAIVFISVPCYLRVLSDETNLLSVAKSLTFTRTAHNVTQGLWRYEVYEPLATLVDKRPLLFPFVLSVAHTVLGYRPGNAFVVNFMVLWATLFLIYLVSRPTLGRWWALVVGVLFVAQPFVTWSATSASFELFNLLFILISCIALRRFLNRPNRASLAFLAMSLLLLANIRYESGVFLLIVGFGLVCQKKITTDVLKPVLVYALMPLGLLPLIWQRVLMLRWPASDMPQGSWVKAFSLDHVVPNLSMFVQHAFCVDGVTGFAGFVNILGVLALVFLLYDILVKRHFAKLATLPVFAFYITACLVGFAAVVLTYFQSGVAVHVMNGRMYLPVLLLLSFAAAWSLVRLVGVDRLRIVPALVGVVCLFIFYHPIALKDRLANMSEVVRDHRTILEFLREQPNKHCCVIADRPGQLAVYNHGAIAFSAANGGVVDMRQWFDERAFAPLYVMQRIAIDTGLPYEDQDLIAAYHLQTLREKQGSSAYILRISQVTEISP